MNKLYENIKNRRNALGMTQQELAEKMGYTNRSSIAKIENAQPITAASNLENKR